MTTVLNIVIALLKLSEISRSVAKYSKAGIPTVFFDRGLTRHHRVYRVRVYAEVQRIAQPERHVMDRPGHAGLQRRRRRVVCECPRSGFLEDADAREEAQDAIERIFGGARRGRQLQDRARPGGELVGDLELYLLYTTRWKRLSGRNLKRAATPRVRAARWKSGRAEPRILL
jgi:hypothetical protein